MQLVAVNAARRPAALPLGDNIHGTNITSKTPGITPERNMQDVACTNCRTRKVRCGRERPQCESCIRDGAECVYSTPTKRVNHVKVLCEGFDEIQTRLIQVQEDISSLTSMFKGARITTDGNPLTLALQGIPQYSSYLGWQPETLSLQNGQDGSNDTSHRHGANPSQLFPLRAPRGYLVRDTETTFEKYYGPWTLLALCRDLGADLRHHFGQDSRAGRHAQALSSWLDTVAEATNGQWESEHKTGPDYLKLQSLEPWNHRPAGGHFQQGTRGICLPSRQVLTIVLDSFLAREEHGTDLFTRPLLETAIERAYSQETMEPPNNPVLDSWAVCFSLIILFVMGADHTGKQDPFIQPLLEVVNTAAQNPSMFLSLRLVNVQALALLSLFVQQSQNETMGDALFSQSCTLAKAMGLFQTGQGLHESSLLSDDEIKERKKLVRSLHIRDRCAAVNRGVHPWCPKRLHKLISPSAAASSRGGSVPPISANQEITPSPQRSSSVVSVPRQERSRSAWSDLAILQGELHLLVFRHTGLESDVESADTTNSTTPEMGSLETSLEVMRLGQSLDNWSQKYDVPSSSGVVPSTLDDVSLHLAFLGTRIRGLQTMAMYRAREGRQLVAALEEQMLRDSRLACLILVTACTSNHEGNAHLTAWLRSLLIQGDQEIHHDNPHDISSSRGVHDPADEANMSTQQRQRITTIPSTYKKQTSSTALPVHRVIVEFPAIAMFLLARASMGLPLGMDHDAQSELPTTQLLARLPVGNRDLHRQDIALLEALSSCFQDTPAVRQLPSGSRVGKLGRVLQELLGTVNSLDQQHEDQIDITIDHDMGMDQHPLSHAGELNSSTIDPLLQEHFPNSLSDDAFMMSPPIHDHTDRTGRLTSLVTAAEGHHHPAWSGVSTDSYPSSTWSTTTTTDNRSQHRHHNSTNSQTQSPLSSAGGFLPTRVASSSSISAAAPGSKRPSSEITTNNDTAASMTFDLSHYINHLGGSGALPSTATTAGGTSSASNDNNNSGSGSNSHNNNTTAANAILMNAMWGGGISDQELMDMGHDDDDNINSDAHNNNTTNTMDEGQDHTGLSITVNNNSSNSNNNSNNVTSQVVHHHPGSSVPQEQQLPTQPYQQQPAQHQSNAANTPRSGGGGGSSSTSYRNHHHHHGTNSGVKRGRSNRSKRPRMSFSLDDDEESDYM